MTQTEQQHRDAWAACRVDDVAQVARSWLDRPALTDLLAALGGPPVEDLKSLISWSSRTLDTRAGNERRAAPSTDWGEAWVSTLDAAAGRLGLLDTAPPQRDVYDAVIVLGGTTSGNRRRVALALQFLRAIDRRIVVGLGAERILSASEYSSDPDSRDETTEWENLRRNLDGQFGPLMTCALETGGMGVAHWRDEQLQDSVGRGFRLLVAPSQDQSRRANTADSIDFFLRRIPLDLRRSVLLLTSAIYAPYQFLAVAPAVLRAGAHSVELVGTPTAKALDHRRHAQQIAQEVHSTLRAAYDLLA